FITPNSFLSPLTTTANVQNAVSAANANDKVWVQAGAYAAGSATATVDNLTVDVPTGVTGFTGLTLGSGVTSGTLSGAGAADLTGNSGNNTLVGNDGNNTITGLDGNDTLTGGGGTNTLDGGTGTDTATFAGDLAHYTISFTGTAPNVSIVVTRTVGGTSVDTIKNVEKLQFNDKTVHVVGSSVGSELTTIQPVINAATAGDVVLVAPGTYAENLTVSKSLTLTGAGSASGNTIISPASGTAFTVSASDVTIEQLRIAGASNTSLSNVGIYSNSVISNLALKNLVVTNHGYGITVHNNAIISGLVITNVSATSNQIGLRTATSGAANNITVTNSAFNDNDYGWQINATSARTNNQNDFSTVTVSNTTFNNNKFKGLYAEKLHNATFTNITVDGSGYGATNPNGVNVNLKYGAFANIAFTNLTVTNSGT
ncbi:MAG: nitrous oxide reductase family maturation protein NosD, partial [Pirellulaceae bacterium]